MAFSTIGHSTRSIEEFLELLQQAGIQKVIDVRRLPGSTRYPQFNQDALSASLAEAGIRYHWAEGLAGRRTVSKQIDFQTNVWWQNRSFHNYADHALGDEFREALAELRKQGEAEPLAIMCSEAVWWRCHRRIIADYLLAAGEQVRHIMAVGNAPEAELSAGAVVQADGRICYPATD